MIKKHRASQLLCILYSFEKRTHALLPVLQECIYVEDEGEVVYYKSDNSVFE